MNKILVIFSIVFGVFGEGSAQWIQQVIPLAAGSFIGRDVQFTDIDNGFVVGPKSVLKTTDGGTNWMNLDGFNTSDLQGLHFLNKNLGWVVGGAAEVKKTTDGGVNWITQSPTQLIGLTKLYSIHFVNESLGWIAGASGTVLKTTDGGTSWSKLSSFPTISTTLKKIYFHNQDLGWVGGGTRFYYTTDGGASWNSVSGFAELRDFQFLNQNLGFAVGTAGADNYVTKTTDGGKTWIYLSSLSTSAFYQYAVTFLNETVGYVGGFAFNLIGFTGFKKTTDGGATWVNLTTEPVYQSGDIYALYFLDENTGWGVGQNAVFKTTNGGITEIEDRQELPNSFKLSQNYPNPFNPVTTIEYQIASASHVTLQVYSLLGEEVAVLVNQEQNPGQYSVAFDASNLPSGVYFYKLVAGSFSESKRMILLK